MYRVPFNKPFVIGEELYNMAQAVMNGHISPNGPYTAKCSDWLRSKLDVEAVLLTTSCTSALELAAMLCDIEPGDEVILPSFTFVSTANAFCLFGAIPRFVDIHPDTLNIDEAMVRQAISPKTRAIVPVHYAGVPCEMNALKSVAKAANVPIVEDAAQALGSTYRGKPAAAIGEFGTFSFHETKNFTCGEGGALILRDPAMLERAEIMLEDGTDRRRLLRGEVDHYEWREAGSALAMPDLLAAYLLAQLEHSERITDHRQVLHEHYRAELEPLAQRGLLQLPTIPAHCTSNYHLFHVLFEDLDTRTRAIEHLAKSGIQAVFHYVPLHTAEVGKRYGYEAGSLPVTERVSECLLRLPMYYELSTDDVSYVCSTLTDFFGA